MAGGLFAIHKKTFVDLGKYDLVRAGQPAEEETPRQSLIPYASLSPSGYGHLGRREH